VHFPELPPLTVDGFKRLIRELNLWTSSCMLATDGGETIGVLLAAKREGEANWIHSIGIRPDRQREGHGRHLLTSLSQKLAILGPPRILAELPGDLEAARRFVAACGFHEHERYTDFVRPATSSAAPSEVPEIVIPITLDELLQNDVFDDDAHRCWCRAPRTLRNLAERLEGLAIASAERVEAWLLYDDGANPAERRLMALRANSDGAGQRMGDLLVRACASTTDRPLVLPGAAESEVSSAVLTRLGFEPGVQTLGLEHLARPG